MTQNTLRNILVLIIYIFETGGQQAMQWTFRTDSIIDIELFNVMLRSGQLTAQYRDGTVILQECKRERGRPRKTAYTDEVQTMHDIIVFQSMHMSMKEIADLLGISRATLYRALKTAKEKGLQDNTLISDLLGGRV